MKRLTIKWRMFLRRILVVFSSGFLTAGACMKMGDEYGPGPVMYGMPPAANGEVKAADTQQAIPGIRVSVAGTQNQTYTDTNGRYRLVSSQLNNESGALLFEDADGTQNGEFYDTTVSWDRDNRLPNIVYTSMQRKDSANNP